MISGPHSETRALVTGGSQGLGLAIARELISQGCRSIVIAARDPEKGEAIVRTLSKSGADVRFVPVDLGNVGSVRAMVQTAADIMGKVTAFANAAALTDRGSILNTTPDEWDRMFAVNAKGPFFAIQEIANRAIEAGHPAQIVNILTMSTHCGQSFLATYSASKAALSVTTLNAANALRQHQIRINGINCGWMDTPGEDMVQRKWHGAQDGWLEQAEAAQPMKQLVKPDHVAGLACYMLGPQSGVMTGSLVDFDQNIAGSFPE